MEPDFFVSAQNASVLETDAFSLIQNNMAIPHDPIFKEFFHRFFREFMEIFFPAEAAQLDFATLKWVEQELISNFPDQIKRISDLIGEIALKNGDEQVILIHLKSKPTDPESCQTECLSITGYFGRCDKNQFCLWP